MKNIKEIDWNKILDDLLETSLTYPHLEDKEIIHYIKEDVTVEELLSWIKFEVEKQC